MNGVLVRPIAWISAKQHQSNGTVLRGVRFSKCADLAVIFEDPVFRDRNESNLQMSHHLFQEYLGYLRCAVHTHSVRM